MKNNFKVGDVVKRVCCENSKVRELDVMLGVGDCGVVKYFDDLNIRIKVSNEDGWSNWYNPKDFEHVGGTQRRGQQNHTWDDITIPSFPLYIEEQTPNKETLEKSLEDIVKLHEDKLREEVKQHRDTIEKDTRGAYQFFLNNEDDIIYKLKMINRPASKSELIKYHKSIFPKLDEKLFGRLLMRKGYIFSTPRNIQGQPFDFIDWLFWCVITCFTCALVLAMLLAMLATFN